jgi:hypothetical protein
MTTFVYCMYGLFGPAWSGGIENVLARAIRQLPNVFCPTTREHTQWPGIVAAIRAQSEGSKTVVIGHSLGAVSAVRVTDDVPVDLLVLYDLAGHIPSKIGKNTGHCIDIFDTVVDIVPNFRIQALPGHEHKIEQWRSQYGHTGVDDSLEIANKIVSRIELLTRPVVA